MKYQCDKHGCKELLCGCPAGVLFDPTAAIYEEILSTYTAQEIAACKTFDDFWRMVDVANGYEGGWEDVREEFKPIYENIFTQLKAFL